MANHFNLSGHSLEGYFEIIPIEQSPILGSKTETNLLRINVESGKSVERDKTIFPLIYNRRNIDIGKTMKETYLNLKTYEKAYYGATTHYI